MTITNRTERQRLWHLNRSAITELQLSRLNRLLESIVPTNSFYREKIGKQAPTIQSLDDLTQLPVTTKQELIEASEQGVWQTFEADRYVRYHQTSGTSGQPLKVQDTADDWAAWLDIWQHVLDAAEISPGSVAMLAFSFGPFIGFWSAFDALVARGVQAVPGGGLSSTGRLELIRRTGATSLFCTPSYALHLAEVAQGQGIDLHTLPIERIVVAGEPGGSLPAVRKRMEGAWQARVVDHAGASEVGPWGMADDLWHVEPGLRIIESDFLAEFISVETGKPAESGELSHLYLTNLRRVGLPVIRYQTGDLVRPYWTDDCEEVANSPCHFVRLAGGLLGRADDMVVIRGVNIYPSSIEQILREFPEVAEFRIVASKLGEMLELRIEVEDALNAPGRIAEALQIRLGLRIDVQSVPAGSLPRSEAKSRRFVREE